MSKQSDIEKTVSTTMSLDLRRRSDVKKYTLPTLRVVAGPDMLRFCSIYPEEEVAIGRDETCELVLHDSSVSRRHAVVKSAADGSLFLMDLRSTNGTALNNVPIPPNTSTRVNIGDHIEFGGVTIRVDRLDMDELAHLARVVERLDLANKDPLTGLVTRLYLDEGLPEVLVRHQHAKVPLTAVFVDVDHFKKVNDTYGHSVGDDALRAVSRLLALSVRDSDTCVRYGGEELLVILPNCDETGGVQMGERVRSAIIAHEWNHYAESMKVTISAGVAQYRDGEGLREWLDRADKALFAAKAAGRDRVARASDLP